MEVIDAALRSTISRVVALLTPVLAAALGVLAFKLQDWLGIDLQQYTAVAASFVATVVLGAALTGLKWLENRGKFETAALAIAHAHAVGAGTATVTAPGVIVTTPTDLPDTRTARGVTAADLGEDPDDGTENHVGADPTQPPGSPEPLE